MPDDAFIQQALTTTFRRRRASGAMTDEDLEGYVTSALAALGAHTTVIEVNFEGGSTKGMLTCSPAVLLAAAEQVLAEFVEGAENQSGAINVDLSCHRIET